MVLVFVRHGPAGRGDSARWPDDRERPLTPRGVERTRRAMRGLARFLPGIDRVWTSPLARASATAEILRRACPAPPPLETLAELSPGGRALPLLREWVRRGKDETLVVVGHEPDLSALAAALLGLRAEALALKKAGACLLELEPGAPANAGRLLWLLPPRALRSLAGRGKVES